MNESDLTVGASFINFKEPEYGLYVDFTREHKGGLTLTYEEKEYALDIKKLIELGILKEK